MVQIAQKLFAVAGKDRAFFGRFDPAWQAAQKFDAQHGFKFTNAARDCRSCDMFAPGSFIDTSGAHDGDKKPDGHDIKLLHGTVVGGSTRSVKQFEGAMI
jgi:hypothetical protein